jgi:2-polyprenyl-6-hydroxyphenyl methylase/3-demethylubiquinone-9 3-methyltransferase
MAEERNVDGSEIRKFDQAAQIWWDPDGEMRTLQVINPLRVAFITEKWDRTSPRVLDVGCGGGILSEALAELGAEVTGIDLSEPAIHAARQHAQEGGLSIDYRVISVEEIAQQQPGSYDVVTCMEMLEHVPKPNQVVAACAQALKPGGHAFFSSINRTPKAFLFAIIGGEYLLRLLPKGSHRYKKLIRPNELIRWSEESGLAFVRSASLLYNPFTGKFKVRHGKQDVNYIIHFRKP